MVDARSPELDLEEIATYVDGRLVGERKARVEELLVRDEDAYEVFLGTLAFEEETAEPDAPAEPVRLAQPWIRRPWRAGALVAAALVIVALGVLLQWALFGRSATGPRMAELVPELAYGTDLDERFGRGWDGNRGWAVTRSGSSADLLTGEQRAFRLGVIAVDLEVALRAGDPRSQRFAGMIRDLADAQNLLVVRNSYDRLSLDFDNVSLEELEERAREAEAGLAQNVDSPRYALGRLAESGRLAAVARDGDVFERPAFRSELQQAMKEAGETVAADLRAVAERLEQDALDGEDFDALVDAFARIIQAAG